MSDLLDFGDEVVIVEAGFPELVVGDHGEVVGKSDDEEFVGVWIQRLRCVYTIAVTQVERVR